MIAIPAYQYSLMLQGKEPTFQIYIKEGECIKAVLPTDMQLAAVEVMRQDNVLENKPAKRKLSAWNKFVANPKNQIRYKNGKLNLKKMAVQYRKKKKGGK